MRHAEPSFAWWHALQLLQRQRRSARHVVEPKAFALRRCWPHRITVLPHHRRSDKTAIHRPIALPRSQRGLVRRTIVVQTKRTFQRAVCERHLEGGTADTAAYVALFARQFVLALGRADGSVGAQLLPPLVRVRGELGHLWKEQFRHVT